jgi:hypothetical protein
MIDICHQKASENYHRELHREDGLPLDFGLSESGRNREDRQQRTALETKFLFQAKDTTNLIGTMEA